MPLKLSEDTKLNLAKMLYREDGEGCAANGGLASASDLGPLPKVNFGGTGLGFEIRRRRNKMQAEENYNELVGRFLKKARERYHIGEEEDATPPADDSAIPPPKTADANMEETDEGVTGIAKRINFLYDSKNEAREPDYMVSWADPRIIGALHKEQHKLGNGLFYVKFDNKNEAVKFFKSLHDQGVGNIKIDTLG